MRKAIGVAVICLAASLAFPATGKVQSLNAKPGLWQMTMTGSGAPMKYKSCLKAKDLSVNPWMQGSHSHCSWTVLNSTSSDLDVKGSACTMGRSGMTVEMHIKLHLPDPEHSAGSIDTTVNAAGRTMHTHANLRGEWIGPTCPAE